MGDNFKPIDFADLYGVKPGEKDFGAAMERASKEGPKRLSETFVDTVRRHKRDKIVSSLEYNASSEAINRGIKSVEDFEDGAEYGYQFAIDKVCKWIETNWEDLGLVWLRGYSGKEYVEFLKEEIENGETGQGTTD